MWIHGIHGFITKYEFSWNETNVVSKLKPFQDFNLQKGPHLHDMCMSFNRPPCERRFNRLGGKKMESCGYAEAWSQRIVMQFTKIHRMGCEKCPLFLALRSGNSFHGLEPCSLHHRKQCIKLINSHQNSWLFGVNRSEVQKCVLLDFWSSDISKRVRLHLRTRNLNTL